MSCLCRRNNTNVLTMLSQSDKGVCRLPPDARLEQVKDISGAKFPSINKVSVENWQTIRPAVAKIREILRLLARPPIDQIKVADATHWFHQIPKPISHEV
ncbi:hypothetical protein J6590_047733 [Homalodisca vitripennis]|nr:hypothetical protein J6590_047733 [Homalodisca vitripennis]